jgi:hypothetical protein
MSPKAIARAERRIGEILLATPSQQGIRKSQPPSATEGGSHPSMTPRLAAIETGLK